MSWYRTYRPRSIAGLHLQKVRDLFQQLMKQGQLSQVMLFAGPKGTGKTSTARIIAAMVNDPKNAPVIESLFFHKPAPKSMVLQDPDLSNQDLTAIFEGTSFLVQELDAASNRGIDDIRALKEKLALPPQLGLVTVYILDEAHMLTTEAFNALLKMMEEPPPHVMFILATTESQKIPATITSRATLIQFTRATDDEIATAIQTVLDQEKITSDPEAIAQIALAADGSFRDAVKLAEDLSHRFGKLTLADVKTSLPQAVAQTIEEILLSVLAKEPTEVARLFGELRLRQVDSAQITKQMLECLHQIVMQHLGLQPGKPSIPQAAAMFIIQEILAIPATYSPIPLLPLEIKLLDLIARSQQKNDPGKGPVKASAGSPHQEPIKSHSSPSTAKIALTEADTVITAPPMSDQILMATPVKSWPIDVTSPLQADVIVSDNLQPISSGDSSKLLGQWEVFVELVRNKNSTLAALLKSAELVEANDGRAVIAVYYRFHQEQLQQPKFMKLIEDCVEPVTGGRIKLEFILKDANQPKPVVAEAGSPATDTLASLTEAALS